MSVGEAHKPIRNYFNTPSWQKWQKSVPQSSSPYYPMSTKLMSVE